MGNSVSRRSFVAGMGVAAGLSAIGISSGVAVADEASAPEGVPGFSPFADLDLFAESRVVVADIDPADIEATYDYDVVVVGAGTAGTAAAFAAADKGGVKVAVL